MSFLNLEPNKSILDIRDGTTLPMSFDAAPAYPNCSAVNDREYNAFLRRKIMEVS